MNSYLSLVAKIPDSIMKLLEQHENECTRLTNEHKYYNINYKMSLKQNILST